MPRKRKEQPDGYNKAFPTAMRKLMDQKGTTQYELAEYLSKTRQSISYYCDGSSSPDWETIVKIADFFNVSTDYLLGRTEDPSRLPSIVDDLGLSLKAVDTIEQLQLFDIPDNQIQFRNASNHAMDILNCLLESPDFHEVLGNLLMCFDSFWVKADGYKLKDNYCLFGSDVRFTGHIVLKGDDAGRFYANEAANALNKFACQEIPVLVDSLMKE